MKEIIVKSYLFNDSVLKNKKFVLLKNNTNRKILFYGILFTLMLTSIPLVKTKSHNDNDKIDTSITSINDVNNFEFTSSNMKLIEKTTDNNFILLSTKKPRKMEDIPHEELIKIDDGIYNTGKKIKCLDDTYYANLTYIDYYLANPGITYEDAVIEVNMGLWKPFYSFAAMDGSDFDKNEVLLNKYSKINQERYKEDFDISTLEKIGKTDFLLQSDAHDACEKMMKDASKSNIKLTITGAYLSYEDQKKQYDASVKKIGEKKTELIIERPGHSYAQIGTKVSFKVKKGSDTSKWLYKNAYKYGFVYFAPSGKTRITGYTYNPGAFIYVGTKYAKICHDKNLSFDYVWHKYIFPGCVTFSVAEDEYVYLPTNGNIAYTGETKTYRRHS